MPLPGMKRKLGSGPPPSGSYAGTQVHGTGAWSSFRRSGDYDYSRDVGILWMNSVVRICLAWIGDNIPSAQLKVGRQIGRGKRKGEWVENLTHPASKMFRRPCPVYTARETWTAISAGYKVDGNAYLIKVRDGEDHPTEMWWVANHQVQVNASGDPRRPVAYYRVSGPGSEHKDYSPDDVIHFRDGLDPLNPIMGLSRLKAHLRSIAGMNNGDLITAAILKNAHAGWIISPKSGGPMEFEFVDEANLLRARDQIQHGLSGGNTGKGEAINFPLDFLRTGMGPEELGLDRVLDRPEAMICAALGVNPLVLGLPSGRDSRTYSNIAEARRGAWEDAIIPMQDAIADTLEYSLLYLNDPQTGDLIGEFGDPEGLQVWWDRSEVAALQEDAAERWTRAVGGFESDLVKRNEARTLMNQPPLDDSEGGHLFKSDLYTPPPPVVAEVEPEPEAEPEPEPVADDGEDDDDAV
jgi:hypothetical protein